MKKTLDIPEEYDKTLCSLMAKEFLTAQQAFGDKSPFVGPMWHAFQAAIKYLEEKNANHSDS